MFCTNCGEPMRDTDKFCAECGAAVVPRKPRNAGPVIEQSAATVAQGEPTAPPAPAKLAEDRRAVQSTTEAFRAPLPSVPSSAGVPRQPELAFSAPQAPTGKAPSQAPPAISPVAPRAASEEERQQVLLQGEEMASVRGMVPPEELPEPFPAPAPAYNAWLDTEPVATPAPTPRAKTISAPPPAASAPAPAEPAAKDDNFFYFYDDATAPRQNRKLLITLLVVFALGIAALIYLMLRSPAKSAPPDSVTVAISPTAADVIAGEAHDFAATVTGSGDTDVTWSVEEGSSGGTVINRGAQAQGGTVAVVGVYVAPAMPGTYHVVATSKADPRKSATAEVLVSGK